MCSRNIGDGQGTDTPAFCRRYITFPKQERKRKYQFIKYFFLFPVSFLGTSLTVLPPWFLEALPKWTFSWLVSNRNTYGLMVCAPGMMQFRLCHMTLDSQKNYYKNSMQVMIVQFHGIHKPLCFASFYATSCYLMRSSPFICSAWLENIIQVKG